MPPDSDAAEARRKRQTQVVFHSRRCERWHVHGMVWYGIVSNGNGNGTGNGIGRITSPPPSDTARRRNRPRKTSTRRQCVNPCRRETAPRTPPALPSRSPRARVVVRSFPDNTPLFVTTHTHTRHMSSPHTHPPATCHHHTHTHPPRVITTHTQPPRVSRLHSSLSSLSPPLSLGLTLCSLYIARRVFLVAGSSGEVFFPLSERVDEMK